MHLDDFERLFEEHARDLLGFLAYRIDDRTVAEDLVAETFERALRGRRSFDRRRASEKTWLYAIALNCLRDHSRRQSAEQRALEAASDPPDSASSAAEEVESRDAVRRSLHVLSDEEREAIALRYGGDLTLPEIAKLTGQRLSTVEGRVYRALRKLHAEMADELA